MLKGISPILSPELLKILCEMGHGDTITFGDAHFPSQTLGPQVLRLDGLKITDLLRAVIPLWELDTYVEDSFIMMQPVLGDSLDAEYVRECSEILNKKPYFLERFPFYDAAKKSYCILHTGETRQYGNIIIRKGVIRS